MATNQRASQQSIANLSFQLSRLKWTFSHPKIQAWIEKVSRRTGRSIKSQADLTTHQCNRLARFIEIIYECNRILKFLKISWQDSEVRAIFTKHSFLKDPNAMTIAGWEELYSTLDQRQKEQMPF